MQDGALAHERGVHVIELIENMMGLKYVISNELIDDINLLFFSSSFDWVIMNFNLNKIFDSLEELVNTLITYDITIKQGIVVFLMGLPSDENGPQGKGKKCSAPHKKNNPNKRQTLKDT